MSQQDRTHGVRALEELGDNLERSFRTRPRRFGWSGWRRWRRSTVALAIGLAVLIPGVALATGIWDPSPPEPAPGAGIVAEPGEPVGGSGPAVAPVPDRTVASPKPCVLDHPSAPPVSSKPPAPQLTSMLSVLLRPRSGDDQLAHLPRVGGVNPDAIRLAQTTSSGGRYYVVPAEDINWTASLPDEPECKRFQRPAQAATPGVCLVVDGDGSGSTCTTAEAISAGRAVLTQDHVPGTRPGTAYVAGIVPDGVTSVTLRYPDKSPQGDVDVQVEGNTFATAVNASAAVIPRIFWHTAGGVREVGRSANG